MGPSVGGLGWVQILKFFVGWVRLDPSVGGLGKNGPTDMQLCQSTCLFLSQRKLLVPLNESKVNFINSIGSRVSSITGDAREKQFLWQRLSIAVQRFNSVCLRGTFETLQDAYFYSFLKFFHIYIFFYPWAVYIHRGFY